MPFSFFFLSEEKGRLAKREEEKACEGHQRPEATAHRLRSFSERSTGEDSSRKSRTYVFRNYETHGGRVDETTSERKTGLRNIPLLFLHVLICRCSLVCVASCHVLLRGLVSWCFMCLATNFFSAMETT